MIRFACPGCSATYTASDEKAGKVSTCPKCKTQFEIPGADTAPPPMPQSASPPPPPAATVEIEPCPKCGDKLTVEVGDLGSDVECPTCQKVFTARKAGSAPPPLPKPKNKNEPIEIEPCPKCGTKLTVEPADIGIEVECPSCSRIFTARKPGADAFEAVEERPTRRSRRDDDDEDDDRPRRRGSSSRRRDDDDDDYEDRPRRRRSRRGSSAARAACSGPGTALIVIGCIAVALAFCGAIGTFMNLGGPRAGGGRGGLNNDNDPVSSGIGVVLGFIWSAVVIIGGYNVKNTKSYTAAMIGSIFAMLPCSACCLLGLPFGIWSLVTISKAKDQFDS